MLQTIRENTQGWIAGTIISVIILSFALWGIHSYFTGSTNNINAAEVNGIAITKEQLSVAYERLRRQAQANNTPNMKDEAALKSRALQALVDIEVLKQASIAQGFRISDKQIDGYLQSMPEFQVDGQFSIDRFQEILATTMLSTSEFLDLIKTSLLVDQPKLGVIFTSFALPNETAYTISLVNQEREIQYITIPFQQTLSSAIVIPSEKVKAYYDEHQNDFMTPEQVNVEYIELSLKDIADTIHPTDAQLKNFYNENINAYTQPMQWKFARMEVPVMETAPQDELTAAKNKVTTIYDALNKGEDFNQVAKVNGVSVTNENWMTLNHVPTELQKSVAGLTKAGQISEPARTAKGYVIVKALEVNEPKMQAFELVKDRVKETFIKQHAEEKFASLRDQLASVTYEHPDSLQSASKELALPVKTSELFTKDKAGKDISQYKKVRETAFSSDVLSLQNNSDVIQLNPETVIVLRVKSHTPSTLLAFNTVSKQIEDKLKAAEIERRTAEFANSLVVKLKAGASPADIASANKLTWNTTGMLGRYSNKVDTAILDLAFQLPNPTSTKAPMSYGLTRLPNGYAIVALKAVKDGNATEDRQQSVYSEQIQNSEGLLEYELYKQSQDKAAKIDLM